MKTAIRTFMGIDEEYIVFRDEQENAIREIVREEFDKRQQEVVDSVNKEIKQYLIMKRGKYEL